MPEIDYDLVLFEKIYEQFLDAPDARAGEDIIGPLLVSLLSPGSAFNALSMQAFITEAGEEDTAVLPMGDRAYFGLLKKMSSPSAWSFLDIGENIAIGHWKRDLDTLESFCCLKLLSNNGRLCHQYREVLGGFAISCMPFLAKDDAATFNTILIVLPAPIHIFIFKSFPWTSCWTLKRGGHHQDPHQIFLAARHS